MLRFVALTDKLMIIINSSCLFPIKWTRIMTKGALHNLL